MLNSRGGAGVAEFVRLALCGLGASAFQMIKHDCGDAKIEYGNSQGYADLHFPANDLHQALRIIEVQDRVRVKMARQGDIKTTRGSYDSIGMAVSALDPHVELRFRGILKGLQKISISPKGLVCDHEFVDAELPIGYSQSLQIVNVKVPSSKCSSDLHKSWPVKSKLASWLKVHLIKIHLWIGQQISLS